MTDVTIKGAPWDVIQRCKDYEFRARVLESLRDPQVQARLAQDPAAVQFLRRLLGGEGQQAALVAGNASAWRAPSRVHIEEVLPEPVAAGLSPPAPALAVTPPHNAAATLRADGDFFPSAASPTGSMRDSALPLPMPASAQMETLFATGAKRKAEWDSSMEARKRSKAKAENICAMELD